MHLKLIPTYKRTNADVNGYIEGPIFSNREYTLRDISHYID